MVEVRSPHVGGGPQRVSNHRLGEVGSCHDRAAQVGAVHVGRLEAAAAQVGVAQVAFDHVRLAEVGVAQVRSHQADPVHATETDGSTA